MPPQGNSAWRVTTARVLRRREARGVVLGNVRTALVGNYARGDDGCTPGHGPATGASAPIGVALHAVPCGRSNDSRGGRRVPDAPNVRVVAERLSSDWRTRRASRSRAVWIRADAGSPMSADTPAAARFATARQRSVCRHSGKKCRSEQGFREFRQRASPHRPTTSGTNVRFRAGRRALHHRPAPHHVEGRVDRSRLAHGSRQAPSGAAASREERRSARDDPGVEDGPSLERPQRSSSPGGPPGTDMERRARGCAPQACWPAWPRPSGSSPRASPAPP